MLYKTIILLTDYKNLFGSKQKSSIYKGGMDLFKLKHNFSNKNYEVKVLTFREVPKVIDEVVSPIVLYTSSEDQNSFYKSFIEDVVFHLELKGINILPKYKYLRAHNNKVFMELLRENSDYKAIKTIKSYFYGTLDELIKDLNKLQFPVVIKTSSGAMSSGVAKANSADELVKIAKSISRSLNIKHDLKEYLREIKYRKQYIKDSFYRKKFIVQNFIPNMNNDWKVLVYGNRCYVLFRRNRKNDFRASGSGDFHFIKGIPNGLLDYAYSVKEHFCVPNISMDVCYDGIQFHLIEFQFLYFGTTTIEKAPFHFCLNNNEWQVVEGYSDLEEVYVDSITEFIKL